MIKELYQKIIPYVIRKKIAYYKELHKEQMLVRNIIDALSKENQTKEILEIKNYLIHTQFKSIPYDYIFPYDYKNEYAFSNIPIYIDGMGYKYVLHNGKPLYGKFKWNDEELKKYYCSLLIEQDKRSPHCYLLNEERSAMKGMVVADIGAAEGIFALEVIDDIEKVYLFECDEEWIEPLKKTFKKYSDKVEIVEKYISNVNDDKNLTLDSFFEDKRIDYIKADIEGAEISMLIGGERVLKEKIKKCLICTYHKYDDYENITQILKNNNLCIDTNPGYMLYRWTEFYEPYIRRGVVFGYKTIE